MRMTKMKDKDGVAQGDDANGEDGVAMGDDTDGEVLDLRRKERVRTGQITCGTVEQSLSQMEESDYINLCTCETESMIRVSQVHKRGTGRLVSPQSDGGK